MRRLLALAGILAILGAGCARGPVPIVVGAIYPMSGSQASGGIEEFRGVALAAELANRSGGVDGRPIALRPLDVPSSDVARAAIRRLDSDGVRVVIGSYGSTISEPAADEAANRGMLFWETGAVGEMTGAGAGSRVFRMPATGPTLGRAAIAFIVDQLAPRLDRSSRALRFVVTEVDDAYGRAVAAGATDELESRGLHLAGTVSYDPHRPRPGRVAARIAALHPDVLFAAAYVSDGVGVRRALVRRGVHLTAGIGTSSSYCMLAFGRRLGGDAVGLFASDKPDADAIDPSGLLPSGRGLLTWARTTYRERFGTEMPAAALSGFSNAWVLFHLALPGAGSDDPGAVGTAAAALDVPNGSLPNGSGVRFAPPGDSDAGDNLRAASVIWEWVRPGRREVVWPPRFATHPVEVLRLAP